jgi:hypothetical protein
MGVFTGLGGEPSTLHNCITCGAELHPERARKYNYCMSPGCQEKNVKGLTMVAVGVNKAAEQYLLLDEDTKEELASGKYHDQRRGSYGTSGPVGPSPGAAPTGSTRPAARRTRPAPAEARGTAVGQAAPPPWTDKQRRLALLYNEQGLRPGEIAQKLGLSTYVVTQIILTSRNRGKV